MPLTASGPLEITAAVLVAHRLTVQVELDDVFGAYQLRGERTALRTSAA
jgi:hypothetical protein